MQLVVAQPPGDEVVIEDAEVAGKIIVVERGGIDGLHGQIPIDPCVPLAAQPAVHDVEIRSLG